jgi:hypothetical protein
MRVLVAAFQLQFHTVGQNTRYNPIIPQDIFFSYFARCIFMINDFGCSILYSDFKLQANLYLRNVNMTINESQIQLYSGEPETSSMEETINY